MNQSGLDYFSGQQASAMAWGTYAASMQNRLSQAEVDFVSAETGRIGFAHLFKLVSEELRRLDPSNPLLQRETQLRLLGEKVSEKASQMGYVYDNQKGRIVGRR